MNMVFLLYTLQLSQATNIITFESDCVLSTIRLWSAKNWQQFFGNRQQLLPIGHKFGNRCRYLLFLNIFITYTLSVD